MGSDDKKKKEKDRQRSRKKQKKKSRERTPSSSSESSSSAVRKKKTNKKKQKISEQSQPMKQQSVSKYMYSQVPPYDRPPPNYPPYPNMFLNSINPPPPAQPIPTAPSKTPKAKELNLFKVLPSLQWSSIMFSNTIFSVQLLGQNNYEVMMNKLWKSLQKKVKAMGIKRLTKLVSDGMGTNEKLFASWKQQTNITTNTINEQDNNNNINNNQTGNVKQSYSDFEILTAIYEKKSKQQIKKMISPQSKLLWQDIQSAIQQERLENIK